MHSVMNRGSTGSRSRGDSAPQRFRAFQPRDLADSDLRTHAGFADDVLVARPAAA
ncbi:hypothetical protein KMT30_27255 [Streptomyces sp. IBSBF 2953]|uniref:hypothetical protein n=1 Tax=Streptomyces TaxID=1883 RepID=UPI002119E496|nr:hypothetical protein [Streptomyces scabiei]MCQ9182676.1 hypothetical protein [Streptomyces hayashii]MDX3117389.1 hypothetical protein [Streptomyces scabiei]